MTVLLTQTASKVDGVVRASFAAEAFKVAHHILVQLMRHQINEREAHGAALAPVAMRA